MNIFQYERDPKSILANWYNFPHEVRARLKNVHNIEKEDVVGILEAVDGHNAKDYHFFCIQNNKSFYYYFAAGADNLWSERSAGNYSIPRMREIWINRVQEYTKSNLDILDVYFDVEINMDA
tara:strand:+ start:5820 stop:6185 length:366 start_codon:yes stop_codon:yes gene_type:complete